MADKVADMEVDKLADMVADMSKTKSIKPEMLKKKMYWAKAVLCETYLTCISSIKA